MKIMEGNMDLNYLKQNLINLENEYDCYDYKFNDIEILKIIPEGITKPKNDGTPGCALYKIPFKLSKAPDNLWIQLFIQNWNQPFKYSMMHRTEIASIINDQLILDGTTLDEVKTYHQESMKKCVKETNISWEEWIKNDYEQKIKKLKSEIEYYTKIQKESEVIKF